MTSDDYFIRRDGCPFCQGPGHSVSCEVDYSTTAEADKRIPNIHGRLLDCHECGITFSSHGCKLDAFAMFYNTSLASHKVVDKSLLQRVRVAAIRELWRNGHDTGSWLQWLAKHSLNILHLPILSRPLKGLRVLDVGAGLGEFMKVSTDLGATVVGTEVLPSLVEYIRSQNMICHLGEVENIELESGSFDVILCRAVLYRTTSPKRTLEAFRRLLKPDGELALVDPCPSDSVEWFARKQFPQGHYYIRDIGKYLKVLQGFGFHCHRQHMIFGRPDALLKHLSVTKALICALQLLEGNLRRRRPYLLNYCCSKIVETRANQTAP